MSISEIRKAENGCGADWKGTRNEVGVYGTSTQVIEDDTEVVQDKDWTSLPTTHIDPEVVTDASSFSPQTQPTSEPKDETKTVTVDEPTPRGRPPVKLPDFDQADPIPNTGGRYPAPVVHRADVIVETDLDTGEHTAALVELKGKPQVGERQPLPAAAKNIQGRTLAVDVLTGGGFEVNPIKRKGRHTVRPQEVEGILPLPKAQKKPKLKPPRPAIPRPQRVGTKRGKRRAKPPWLQVPRLPGQRRKR